MQDRTINMVSSVPFEKGRLLRGWLPVLLLPAAVLVFTPPAWPRWAFMWLLCFALYFGCKWLTWRRTPVTNAHWWRHATYLLAWPGMDPKAFLTTKMWRPLGSGELLSTAAPSTFEWLSAAGNCFIGIVLFWTAALIVPHNVVLLIGWLGMVGIAFALHFGVFHLLSCAWRATGIDARPLMNRPFAAKSVSEFWGRRWNIAFRDLTYRFFFRPLSNSLGPRWGMLAGFLFSGLIHELVISVPARGGYGGPTLFFVIQAIALQFERSSVGKTIGLGHGWRGWLYTMLVLTLPVYVLFHPPFIRNIILPFMAALGGA